MKWPALELCDNCRPKNNPDSRLQLASSHTNFQEYLWPCTQFWSNPSNIPLLFQNIYASQKSGLRSSSLQSKHEERKIAGYRGRRLISMPLASRLKVCHGWFNRCFWMTMKKFPWTLWPISLDSVTMEDGWPMKETGMIELNGSVLWLKQVNNLSKYHGPKCSSECLFFF